VPLGGPGTPFPVPRCQLIVNPVAGRGASMRHLPAIRRRLNRLGVVYDVARTEGPGHATDQARRAAEEGFDVVVAAGGDGTCNEVLNGLMQLRHEVRPLMGVLPVGRGNDFAYGVGVPSELDGACRMLAEGTRRRIDVGHVVGGDFPEGRYFGNGVGIGFDAVAGFVAMNVKLLRGFAAYTLAALATNFVYFRPPVLRIETEGGTIEQLCLLVSVMNGRRIGGGFLTAPSGQPDDGLLDLCITRKVSRMKVFALIPAFMRGTQARSAAVTTGRSRRVVVTAVEGGIPAHADGETLCTEGDRLAIEVRPAQLDVLTGPGVAV